jgi:exodeoxyribonuclease V alpha subunit
MNEVINEALQVETVHLGTFGGAIFIGTVVGKRTRLKCKADLKILTRTPQIGEFWHVRGTLEDHEKHGEQLIVSDCNVTDLPSAGYLASLLKKHRAFRNFYLGEKKIDDLISAFGSDVLLDLLNSSSIKRLSYVVGPAIAEGLVDAWSGLINEVAVLNFLKEHKFPPVLVRKIIALTKYDSIDRLKTNPYGLVCFTGISHNVFRTLEECARKLGIPLDDPRRLVGGVELVLYERLRNGHTGITKAELLIGVEKALKSKIYCEDAIKYALERKVIICTHTDSHGLIFQSVGPAFIEHKLELRIKTLLKGPKQLDLFSLSNDALKQKIAQYSTNHTAKHGYPLTQKQIDAVFMGLTSRCSVLSGYGGTGKTTVLRAIYDIATNLQRTTYLLALSGKAKERIRQATGHKAMTIHAFCKAVENGVNFVLASDPLIVIDESSMVDVALFNHLLQLFDGKPYSLLTVGDTAQLSPVGFGLVWHIMAKSDQIPAMHLTEVHRQAAESHLHKVAMQVRQGTCVQLSAWKGESEGVYFVESDKVNVRETFLDIKLSSPYIQILSPHMSPKFPDSGTKINRLIQKHLTEEQQGIPLGDSWLRINDPVIVTENNYDLELFNGTTGKLIEIVREDDELYGKFMFEMHDKPVFLTIGQIYDVGIKLAYATSVHKSQGSEYESIAISCVVDSEMVERSLIYTALTRAKKLCLIVGSQDCFYSAIAKPTRADSLCVGFKI